MGTSKEVVEFFTGFEPVNAGGREEVVSAGRFLFVCEVVGGGEREDDRFHNSYYRKRKNRGGEVEKVNAGESIGGKDLNMIGGSKYWE